MDIARRDAGTRTWVIEIPFAEWYTVGLVGRILGTSSGVRPAIKRGTLRAYRVNGVIMIKHDDLLAYLKRREDRQDAVDLSAATIVEIIPDDTPQAPTEPQRSNEEYTYPDFQ